MKFNLFLSGSQQESLHGLWWWFPCLVLFPFLIMRLLQESTNAFGPNRNSSEIRERQLTKMSDSSATEFALHLPSDFAIYSTGAFYI